CAEALTALEHPGVASIQIICNVLRRKPLEEVLPKAKAQGVAIIARVPLASGILTGRFTATTTFAPQDHRTFNRHGEAFDIGETFSGVPYESGVAAGQEMVRIAADLGITPAQLALRWLIDQDGVTVTIPGASRPEQARANAATAALAPLSEPVQAELAGLYDRYAAPWVADRW
ncbi:MAG: aldo/keto reductase, partial [Propionibacteriaceae bacterium]|nr:aldo/keto reductase [Propionibacteriaceae bacterium]